MRLRRLSRIAAVTLFAPAIVVMPAPSEAASKPVPVASLTKEVPLVEPSAPEVGDGDVVSKRDVGLAKSETPEVAKDGAPRVLGVSEPKKLPSDLAVFGVTWAHSDSALAVQYRTRSSGEWTSWESAESDQGDDVQADQGREADSSTTREGSDPIVVTGAGEVQVRVLGAEGTDPVDPTLSIIDPGESAADAAQAVSPGSAQAAAARPTIRSRAQWGADESLRRSSPSYGQVRGVVVHHTAGTNNYSQAQVPAIMRGIYAFHVKDRGWNDIGYNFLVDKWGRVWEGRAGGTSAAVSGAHASGFNGVTMGISVMGDYRQVQPSGASVDAITRVIAWKSSVHGFNPQGSFWHQGKTYRAIVGHREVGSTSCPGLVQGHLGAIASRAKNLSGGTGGTGNSSGASVPGVKPPAAPPPTSGLGVADAVMRGTTGALLAVSPAGTGVSYARTLSNENWSSFDRVLVSADVTGDRRPDVVARQSTTGTLYVAPGTSGGVAAPKPLGRGWNTMSHIISPGDWNGDGKADLLAVQASTGQLLLYPGLGNGGFSSGRKIGHGWSGFQFVLAAGDWNGDSKPDLFAVNRSGQGYVYPGNGRGGFGRAVQLKGSYGYSALTAMAGSKSLLAVDGAGTGTVVSNITPTSLRLSRAAPHFRGLNVYSG